MRRCMVHVMIPLAIQCEALLLLTATFVVAATVGDSCVKPIFGSASYTLPWPHITAWLKARCTS